MTSIARLRYLNALYSLKQYTKSVDAGMIIPNELVNVLGFINEGFSKLEYYYLLKTKNNFSDILNKTLEENLEAQREYACFYNYVILIGFIDAYISRNMKFYDKLCQSDHDYAFNVAQNIARAHDLRRCVIEDYASELEDSSTYLEILNNPDTIIPTMSMELSKSQDDNLFNMSGFFQAYLEGYKRTDNTDMEDVVETYQKRKKEYVKYRNKCLNDLESVRHLPIKKNKSLL